MSNTVVYTTTATATNATTNEVTITAIANMAPGLPITFSGSVFGNVVANYTYYIGVVDYSNSAITLNTYPSGPLYPLANGSGTMGVSFTVGGQYIINTGAAPNDGTGDPLRTAFTDTNVNFDQVFAAGPVGSNIQIANNVIRTTNTNGNINLTPNGIGNVVSSGHVLPNSTRIRNLGSPNLRWNTVYSQYLDATSANIGSFGNLTVDVGNLHISGGTNGYVLQTDGTGNLTWTAQTGGSGNGTPAGANTQIQYNNAGNFGATAGFTFDSGSGALNVPGTTTASDFVGNSLRNPDTATTIFANPSNVVINPSSYPFGASWTFDRSGSLTVPGLYEDTTGLITAAPQKSLTLQTQAEYNVVGSFANGSGYSTATNVATTGGTGTGLTVDITAPSGSVTSIVINNPGTGYSNDDTILVTGGDNNCDFVLENPNPSTNSATFPWLFGINGQLTTPGEAWIRSGDDYNSIVFTSNGVDNNGQIKVDGGQNMVVSSNNNFYVKQAGQDRIAVTDTTSDFMAATNVRIQSNKTATANIWTFDSTGNLNLPTNSSNINYANGVSILANIGGNYGDSNVASFLSAFGSNSIVTTGSANVGAVNTTGAVSWPDTSNVYVDSGLHIFGDLGLDMSSPSNVAIIANVGNTLSTWTFGTDGELTTPQGGRLGAAGKGWPGLDGGNGNPLSLTSYYPDGMYSSCINLNPDGSLYIATYGDGTGQQSNWSFTTANLISIGNSTISIAGATGGLGGDSLTIQAGAADQTSYSTNPGGNLNLSGGLGASNDGGGGGQGGNVNITAGLSADPAGVAGNIVLTSGTKTWTFGNNGNITVPASSVIVPTSGTVGLSTPDGNTLAYVDANGFYIDTLYNTSEFEWHFDNSGNLSTPGAISATGNVIGNSFVLANAGSQTTSVIQQNQNPPLGSEALGIELLTQSTSNPEIYSSVSAGPDYVGLVSSNAGNANILLQGGYGISINTSNIAGNNIQTWNFLSTGVTQIPGNISFPGGQSILVTGTGSGTNSIEITANVNNDISGIDIGEDNPLTIYAQDEVQFITGYGTNNAVWLISPGGTLSGPTPAANIVGDITGVANISTYGNITGVNLLANGIISTTGNITGNYILGNGSQLTGIQTTSTEPNFTIQTGNFAATTGSRYGVNTVSNVVTATLPSTPATGGAIFFADAGGAFATNNLIINPNGGTIMGASGNMTVSTNNQSFGLFYNGTTWRTYNAG